MLNNDTANDIPLEVLPSNTEERETAESESILFCENHTPKIPLVSLLALRQTVRNNPEGTKAVYQAVCPACGCKTFKKRVERVAVQAIPPFIMVDLDTIGELTLIKLRKR